MQVYLDKMLVLVCTKFNGKFDKGGKPYFLHCLKVMQLLNSDDDELNSIAVGHDLVEDTDVSFIDLLSDGFSYRIVDGIRALTKQKGESKEEYLAKILANEDACKVKLADLTHNSDIRRLKGISERDIERMKKYHTMYLSIKQHMEKE
jgi:(p)ppGpp synthase/HD superfamily hydrolase